jgi:hypothetical protein
MVQGDSVHKIAQTGFGNGTNELYDRSFVSTSVYEITHPLFQSSSVVSFGCSQVHPPRGCRFWLARHSRVQPLSSRFFRSVILNLLPARVGSGTGIFTRAILAHPDWATAVGKITAVEPSEGMRGIFNNSVQDERVSCQNGSFENTGVTNHSADLVIVAQVQSSSYYSINTAKTSPLFRHFTGVGTTTLRQRSFRGS